MARIILSTNPAKRSASGMISSSYDLTGAAPMHPRKVIEVKTAAEADAAFAAYRAEVEQLGMGAKTSMLLMDGDRAPRGFKALPWYAYVNL